MKDIIYTPFNRVAIVEDIIYNNIIDAYNIRKNASISQLWFYSNILTDDDNVDDIDNSFNYNLSIIKKYCPNTYNTFIFTPIFDKDNEELEYKLDINRDLLFQCGYILERLFSERFFTYINSLEGDELSGDDTDIGDSDDDTNDNDNDDSDDDDSDDDDDDTHSSNESDDDD